MLDAVVVGAGHNGLVAANMLADAGWEVAVLEAQPVAGGAVRSAELTRPGFAHDVFSAFYPLAAASPVLCRLELESYGLQWCRSPLVLAHPTPEGPCAVLSTDVEETAASLDLFAPGDGDAWRRLYGLWERVGQDFVEALTSPFPPVRSAVKLAAGLGRRGLFDFARHSLLPVRRLAEEHFTGAGGGLLMAGNAMHTDLSPEAAMSGMFGWLLCCLGQEHGFPVPRGGAGELVGSLVRRLESRGGTLHCDTRVTRIDVRQGRAVGVTTADGDAVPVRRAVLADVGAPALYLELVGAEHLSAPLVEDVGRFQYDSATVKVDWALSGPVRWSAEAAARAGTVHVAQNLDAMTEFAAQLAQGLVPARPFLVFGQMNVADPTRSPAGTETGWAYTHVPQRVRGDVLGRLKGTWDRGEEEAFVERMEDEVEALAPGFRDLILDRHVLTPASLPETNANLVGGAVNGGTAQMHQQLVFRPTPGLGRAETSIPGLYLASASAHPGGGVHG
ncbi:MAG TPA: NAD(P)/FAD-dependent oxidoreductase, partial [Acidimicrobiales bacterium]|nr:NAD(P)/FAD-dependent oxidoreductase [Acidimicrobiales bacterium]